MLQCRSQILLTSLDRKKGPMGARLGLDPADISIRADEHALNPGQFGTSRLCGVWFDPSRPHDTLRHTVHG